MQFTMETSKKQILRNGEEKSTSYRADSLASLFQWQEKGKAQTTIATSGRKCCELLEKSSRIGLLAKMLLESSRWLSRWRNLSWTASTMYSERLTVKEYTYGNNSQQKEYVRILSERDIKSNRLLFRLVPSERRTAAIEFGLLPTVMTQGLKRLNPNGKTEFYPLDLIPTPTAIDCNGGRINKSLSPNAKERPTIAKMVTMGLLPTPTASDKNTGIPKGRQSDSKHLIACQIGKNSQLNPLYVQEMMGFPSLWTELPFQSGEEKQSKPTETP